MRTTNLRDEHAVADLMTGWIHRDVGAWDSLRALFHPDARISLSWFTGPALEFVDASARMSQSKLRTKHVMSAPSMRFSRTGLRAVTETNAIVVAESPELLLGAVTHCRFLDRIERRNGRWAIVNRAAIYDFSSFTFPAGPSVSLDATVVTRYPAEYAALAYLFEFSGVPIGEAVTVKDSAGERELKDSAAQWLEQNVDPAARR